MDIYGGHQRRADREGRGRGAADHVEAHGQDQEEGPDELRDEVRARLTDRVRGLHELVRTCNSLTSRSNARAAACEALKKSPHARRIVVDGASRKKKRDAAAVAGVSHAG